jgi:hypothetical protein
MHGGDATDRPSGRWWIDGDRHCADAGGGTECDESIGKPAEDGRWKVVWINRSTGRARSRLAPTE